MTVMSEPRYAIGDLADLGGVSRRTVRYYVQEGLLPSPFGLGRGNHYGPEHLDRLRRIKAMQEAGQSLGEIRAGLGGRDTAVPPAPAPIPATPTLWRHLEVAPGVRLQVALAVRMPAPARLRELAEWCQQHFIRGYDGHEDDHA
jgi:DNA-binding transcriptional MerR regulator